MSFEPLLPHFWKQVVTQWLKDDVPSFDYGGFVVGDRVQSATLYAKASGVLAGVPFFRAVFEELGCSVEFFIEEGVKIDCPDGSKIPVARVTGPVRSILMGERTGLELIVRSSSISTHARMCVDLAREHGYRGVVAGTRKLAPGLRLVDKYALLVGGADTHRMDLSSMIMLKDNHIASAGGITNAVKAAKSVGGFSLKVEVEVSTLEDGREAAGAGADIVMLDNFGSEELKAVARTLKAEFPHVILEGSGGLRLDSIARFFSPDIDVLSVGALTQSIAPIDFSLKVDVGVQQ